MLAGLLHPRGRRTRSSLVSSARLWARPQVWMSREGLAVPEELDVPLGAPVGAARVPSIPPCHTHTPVAGLMGLCVTHVCDCPCLEGCWCAGCSQEALWMLILYLIYSRESSVLQMRFAEGPKNGQTFAWINFPCCISESPTVSIGPGR